MDVFVTSKNTEDPNKNEGARVATTLNIDFSHSQGRTILQSRVGSGCNSNSSEMFEIRTHPRCYDYPYYFQV